MPKTLNTQETAFARELAALFKKYDIELFINNPYVEPSIEFFALAVYGDDGELITPAIDIETDNTALDFNDISLLIGE